MVRAALWVVLPVVGLLLAGLLADFLPREEVYSSLDYGFSLATLLGAIGCAGYLAVRISRGSGALAFACCVSAWSLTAASARGENVAGEGADWPVLVALLLGPFIVLLAGLGGWV
jgi:hypothetical protein